MIYYDWTDVSEGVDINKTNESKECDICILVFSRYVIDVLNINGVDYCCNINGVLKSEAVNILRKAKHYKNNLVLSYIKMDKKIIKFGETEIKKHKCHQHKSPISIYNVDINKILACNQVSFTKKSFNCFKDGKKFRPLFLMLPKLSGCRKCFDKTKYMTFLIKDDELIKNLMKFWKKLGIVSQKNLIVNLHKMKNM